MKSTTPYSYRYPAGPASAVFALALLTFAAPAARAANGNWNADAAGNWSAAASWSPAVVPGTAAGDTVGLTNNITGTRMVTIDTTSRTVGILNIGDSGVTTLKGWDSFILAASGGATLTLNNNGSSAQINQSTTLGSDTISAPLVLADNLTVNNAAGLTISGVISESSPGKTLAKSTGTGSLTLSGANTYTGVTTLNNGTLRVAGAETAGTSGPLGNSVANNPGSIVLNGGTLQYSRANQNDYSGRFSTADNQLYNVDTDGQNATWSTALTSSGGILTKSGTGTLTLNSSSASTFVGGITLNGGTLLEDFTGMGSNPDLLANGNTLTLAGGTLTVLGKTGSYTAAQTLGNVTVAARGGAILGNVNGGTSTTITLGSLTSTATGGSLLLGTAGTTTTGLTITTTTQADGTGIYGGRAVWFNGTANTGYDWATSTGAGTYTLSGLASYTPLPTTSGSFSTNYKMTAGTTLGGSFSVNTLKLEAPTGDLALGANTLTLAGGGLLMTGTTARNISGGGSPGLTSTFGSGTYDLVIHQFNSGGLTISSVIGDSGGTPVALTKAGSGKLTVSAANTFTGGVNLNGGILSISATETAGTSGPLGKSGTISFNGGTLQYPNSGNTFDYSTRFSTTANQQYNVDTGSAAVTWAANLTSPGGSLTKSGTGTLTLSGISTFTGGMVINGGMVQCSNGYRNLFGWPGEVTVNSGGTLAMWASAFATNLVLNGGSLRQNQGNACSWFGPIYLAADSSFDQNYNNAVTIYGVVSGPGGITHTQSNSNSSNAWVLTNTNTYTGNTIAKSGKLQLSATGSINNSAQISILAGGIFDVSPIANFTLSSNTTLAASGTGYSSTLQATLIGGTTVNLASQPISLVSNAASSSLVVSQGALTLNNNPFTINNNSGAALGAGTYPLIYVTGGTINQNATPSYPVTVTGSGIVADCYAAISVGAGYVNLVVSGPSTPDHLGFTVQPTSTTAGSAMANVVVQIQDASGNPLVHSGTTITLALNGGTIYSGSTTATTDANGRATFSNLVIRTAGSGMTFTATGTYTAATSNSFNIAPAAASTMAFTTQPAGTSVGNMMFPVAVQLRDAYGNVVAQSGTAVTLALNGGSGLSGTIPQTTDSTGTATFSDLTISVANINLTFTASASGLTPATSTSFNIAASLYTPTTLAVTDVNSGSNPVAGVPFSVIVEAHDTGGTARNVSSDTAVSISITTGTGILTGITTGTILSGNSSVTISGVVDTKAESGVIITAQRTGGDILGNGSSGAFAVLPANPNSLIVSGIPSPQGVGVAGSVTVTVKDAYANTVTNYTGTIQFTSTDTSATLPANYPFTGGDAGSHTFTNGVTFATAGTQSVTATDTGAGSVTGSQSGITVYVIPTTFNWTNSGSGTWSVATNWSNASGLPLAPLTTGQSNYTLNFNQAGTYTATNDLSSTFQVNLLHFGGSTATLAGNRVILSADGTTMPRINQTSSAAVVIGNDVVLGANTTVDGAGSGQVDLGGLISGTGSLAKSNSGVLKVYGYNLTTHSVVPNTYSGGTVVNNGTLHLGTMDGGISYLCTNPVGTGTVTLASGATIEFDYVTVTNPLISNGGKIASVNGWGFNWNGPITLNATTTIDTTSGNAGGVNLGGGVSGVGGLIVTGRNLPVTLTGTLSYTGNTTVNAGTLSINSAFLSDTSTVTIASGAKMNLNTGGASDTVGVLILGGVTVPPGVYNSSHPTYGSYFTGSGSLVIGTAYDLWAGSQGLTGAAAAADADPDHDGLANALEFVLGGQPNPARANSNSTGLLPQMTTNSSGDMLFTFQRKEASNTTATVTFQWSTDLTFPSSNDVPVPTSGSSGTPGVDVTVDVTTGVPDAATDTVVVTVPAFKAAGGKVFGRLHVTVP